MESYASIRNFVQRCATLQRIDIVILNAGLMSFSYRTAAETGHEVSFQVNYYSNAYLRLLLVSVLQSKRAPGVARPPVLSIVGSDAAYMVQLKATDPLLPQFDDPKTFSAGDAYGGAKLLLTFFVSRLAELVDPEDVIINLSNPGMTKGASFGHDGNFILIAFFRVLQYFIARSTEVGASVYLDAALVKGREPWKLCQRVGYQCIRTALVYGGGKAVGSKVDGGKLWKN